MHQRIGKLFCNFVSSNTCRPGNPRHHNIYYHITDIKQYAMSDPSGNITESAGDVADRLVGEIEDILGYIFYKKSPNDENENNVNDEIDENENNDDSDSNSDDDNEASISGVDSQRHFTSKLYRCSQDKAMANYSSSRKLK